MRFLRVFVAAGLAGGAPIVFAAPLMAQASAPAALTKADVQQTDRRLKKLEGEMRAVQRKVFPGGAGADVVAPEIMAPDAAAAGGAPASNPLTDLARRVGEMERQLSTLTGQVEANEFKLRQLETAMERTRGDVEFRLGRLEGGDTAAGGAAGLTSGTFAEIPAASATIVKPPAPTVPGARSGAMVPPVGRAPVAAAPEPMPELAPSAASAPAVAKGETAAADWSASYAHALKKDWPKAETHMAAFLVNWPESFRMAQAQYWLGRSFAERSMHAQAADAYLKVYNNHPRNDRAPDALLGLAGALIGIKNPQQACRVLGELDSVYGAKLGATRSADAKALRAEAKCS